MNLFDFLKGKLLFVLAQGFIIIYLGFLLSAYNVSNSAIILICLTILLITVATLLIEFCRKRYYYNNLYNTLEAMEKRQYISQMIERPSFSEGKVLCDVLSQVTKAMNDEIAKYQIVQEEYQEYIETWIHEVKLPISCIGLICENNKNEVTQSILEETSRIDSFVEQALYYARSTNVEKDYSIRDIQLESVVKSMIKKNAKQLIACKTELKLDGLDYIVYSDPKWLDFILGQLISNSIKYRRESFKLSISAEETNMNVVLKISDNGIGISEKDLNRVFEKGFTGENGRKYGKSTGIGLYLCKKLCERMHLGIEIVSTKDIGTTVKITFPKDKSIVWG